MYYPEVYWDNCCKRFITEASVSNGPDGEYGWDKDVHEYRAVGRLEQYERLENLITRDMELKDSWIIWCPESSLPPRVKFDTEEAAAKVAQHMAHKNPGNRFCVCKVAGVAQLVTVKYTSFTEPKARSKSL